MSFRFSWGKVLSFFLGFLGESWKSLFFTFSPIFLTGRDFEIQPWNERLPLCSTSSRWHSGGSSTWRRSSRTSDPCEWSAAAHTWLRSSESIKAGRQLQDERFAKRKMDPPCAALRWTPCVLEWVKKQPSVHDARRSRGQDLRRL